jgi:hypothetical protein
MTGLESIHDGIPFSLDVGAVGMKPGLESRCPENLLALGDIGGEGDTHSDGNNRDIDDDLHQHLPEAIAPRRGYTVFRRWCLPEYSYPALRSSPGEVHRTGRQAEVFTDNPEKEE